MPPKPFKPPRPFTTVSSNTSKLKPGPSRPRKSFSATPASGSKRIASPVPRLKAKTGAGIDKAKGRRVSAREMGLPSLSPDSQPASQPLSVPASDHEAGGRDEDDPFAEHSAVRDRDGDVDGRQEKIPQELLTVLLQQFFENQGTRLSVGARKAVGRYMETFVREGITRCAWARSEEMGGEDGGGGVLEVEDLEKLAPQLLMDF